VAHPCTDWFDGWPRRLRNFTRMSSALGAGAGLTSRRITSEPPWSCSRTSMCSDSSTLARVCGAYRSMRLSCGTPGEAGHRSPANPHPRPGQGPPDSRGRKRGGRGNEASRGPEDLGPDKPAHPRGLQGHPVAPRPWNSCTVLRAAEGATARFDDRSCRCLTGPGPLISGAWPRRNQPARNTLPEGSRSLGAGR